MGGGGVGAGKVERAKNAREVLAIDGGVDRAAIGEDIGGAAAWGEVEATGGGEEGIAHGFEVEALAIHPPEKMVIGIGALVERVVVATLLVGGGEEDEAVEIFERPAVGDEVGGEVIEEFGLGGWGGADPEIAGGADEAGAEVVEPDAVDGDAGGEGVVFVGDGLGEFEATAAFLERLTVFGGENLEKLAGHGVAEVAGFAAFKDVWFYGLREVDYGHGAGWSVCGVGLPGVYFFAELGEFAAFFGVEAFFDLIDGWAGG